MVCHLCCVIVGDGKREESGLDDDEIVQSCSGLF